ncbi:hypothetical protein MBIO_0279 [Mycoplasmopsis fermentans PG18]|uniref:Uncharacterized protein n=2 Tax=Mycoplasmopsis fermentans TaxID=2115 RepID=C4XEH2_MYCFP|nr:hypothetical protein [Mycoplasmopsis fermentans]VEU66666.1 Uncharacterised protein [Mesomycoplasma conjunctivae]VEU60148.1 Uncharacterised protein [Mycoplasmopsis fermentans]VEU60273.1 Uncharacterised protein [Mycoplasmopsis fermentans]VEU66841.1 Uncharacterised protein [Mesomycoplasma conjunctivae]VEU67414.1 Uncharacterised protein [Mesomycoplasma conjunctivae]
MKITSLYYANNNPGISVLKNTSTYVLDEFVKYSAIIFGILFAIAFVTSIITIAMNAAFTSKGNNTPAKLKKALNGSLISCGVLLALLILGPGLCGLISNSLK